MSRTGRLLRSAVLALAAMLVVGTAAAHDDVHRDGPTVPGDTRLLALDAAEVRNLSDAYRAYLDESLTVRRATAHTVRLAEARGFRRVDPEGKKKKKKKKGRLRPGDRLIFSADDRAVALVVIGERPVSDGLRIVATHHDTPSPRIDPLPLRAPKGEAGVAHLTAHPYGGIRPYHWVRRPLAIAGEVYKKDGSVVDVTLGMPADGFSFEITDLETTPEYDTTNPGWVYGFRLVAATAPSTHGGAKSPVALSVLEVLHRRYGLTEDDLGAVNLRAVPVTGAREVGLDRRLVGAWGQDDRLNSYAAVRAVVDMEGTPPFTAMALLSDREEIGSTGTSGMRSEWFEQVVSRLLEGTGGTTDGSSLRTTLHRTLSISADTPAAVNPIFADVHEHRNAAHLGHGPALFKFTGRAGKSGGSDAEPAMVAHVKRVFGAAGVPLQTTELGKIDEGGGGTVATYLARRGVHVVDVGAAVVSMHSPLELSHKHDLIWAVRGFRAFLRDGATEAAVLRAE